MRNLFAATSAVALATVVGTTAAEGQVYIPPQCEVETSHFLVKQASIYVKAAAEARNPEDKNEALQDAFRVLEDAISRGEEGNPNLWYFYGRAYQMVPDWPGMDSAFAKVESMLPDCEDDTDTHRYSAWVPVYNQAVEALQANDMQGAKPYLVEAAHIYHKEPYVPFYLASILAQEDQVDSAMTLFAETVQTVVREADSSGSMPSHDLDDPQVLTHDYGQYQEAFELSMFNLARLSHRTEDYDAAADWYERYRQIKPNDAMALTGLAAVYEASGRSDEANALYGDILTASDSMTALELFSTGVSLYQGSNYQQAAQAFELGLEKSPYHRDGLYNLAQSYFAIASPDEPTDTTATDSTPSAEEMARRNQAAEQMLGAAKRLIRVDYQNEDSQRLLAAAYQLMGDQDSTLAVIMRLDSIEFDITIFSFSEGETTSEIQGAITNRKDREITVPDIQFEFIDAQGTVLGTETLPGQTLAPGTSAEFTLSPQIPGIKAWKYTFEGAPMMGTGGVDTPSGGG
jgi:tetratricopeptide (TPR) repeat protein